MTKPKYKVWDKVVLLPNMDETNLVYCHIQAVDIMRWVNPRYSANNKDWNTEQYFRKPTEQELHTYFN